MRQPMPCSCAGRPGYWSVIFFQQLASIGNNLTIQIVAGQSMKAGAPVWLLQPRLASRACR